MVWRHFGWGGEWVTCNATKGQPLFIGVRAKKLRFLLKNALDSMCSQELPFLFVILSGFYSKLGLKVAKIMILFSKFGQFWKSTRWWEMVHQNLDSSSTRYLHSISEKIQTAPGGPSFRIWWPLSWPLAFIWCRKIFLRINLNIGAT